MKIRQARKWAKEFCERGVLFFFLLFLLLLLVSVSCGEGVGTDQRYYFMPCSMATAFHAARTVCMDGDIKNYDRLCFRTVEGFIARVI